MPYAPPSPTASPPARRGLALLALSAALLAATGCDSVVAPERVNAAPSGPSLAAQVRPAPPRLTVQTPQYPASVLYILYREYLHKNPGLTSLSPEDPRYQQYLERRLRQLYPGRGYAGMVKDAVAERRQQMKMWKEYERKLREWENTVGIMACTEGMITDPETGEPCQPVGPDPTPEPSPDPTTDPSWEGNEEFQVPPDEMIPTLQMEIDSLQMTPPEVEHLYYQESLAEGSFFTRRDEVIIASTGQRATLDDLIVAAGDGWTPLGRTGGKDGITIQVNQGTVNIVLVSLGVIGWKAYRARQAADRAIARSEQYYPTLNYQGTKRDAHRHIFWHVQLRRYVGGFVANQIGEWHEAKPDNLQRDKVMDLHNNYIGHEVKYKDFRGHWLWDRWDATEWAEKVRNYINRSENAEYIPGWLSSPPDESDAWIREGSVPRSKYIYYAAQ